MTRFAFALTVLAVAALTPAITWAHAHGEDFLIGVNAPTNQLEVEYDPDLYPLALPRSEHLLLVGWALDDPGLIGLDGPDPDDPDFVPVDAAADIGFELLAVSGTAFKVWNPLGPGETGSRFWRGRRTTSRPGGFSRARLVAHRHDGPPLRPRRDGVGRDISVCGSADRRCASGQRSGDGDVCARAERGVVAGGGRVGSRASAAKRLACERCDFGGIPMCSFSSIRRTVVGLLWLSFATVAALAQHSGDIGVGHSAAGQSSVACPTRRISALSRRRDRPVDADPGPDAPTSWRATSPGFDANFAFDPAQDTSCLTTGRRSTSSPTKTCSRRFASSMARRPSTRRVSRCRWALRPCTAT